MSLNNKTPHPHTEDAAAVMKQLRVTNDGLSPEEAQRRLVEYGPNALEEAKGPGALSMFLSQFKDTLVIILIFAALISLLVNVYAGMVSGIPEAPIDSIVIMIIVVINAILGFTQEYRAEKSIEALQKMAAPQAHVLRDGEPIDIPATEVVPGDILRLEMGDRLPADARLIESHNIYTDEASLTGESLPVKKDANKIFDRNIPLAEQVNMVHASTAITSGRGLAVVTETGMNTEIGRIAGFISEAGEKETPQQKRMRQLGRQLGVAILIICMIVLTVQVVVDWLFTILDFSTFLDLFVIAVALAVAAIPEGLPAVVTITLALGVQRMVKRNAIIRRLPAVETLGSADIICSDKTGTLTKDEMTVRELYVPGYSVTVTGAGYSPEGSFFADGQQINPLDNDQIALLLRIGALCSNAVVRQHDGSWEVFGDPTEGALVVASQKAGYTASLLNEYPRIAELPFEPDRKRMSTLHDSPQQETIAYIKGAPEVVLQQSTHIYTKNGIQPLTKDQRGEILSNNDKMANKALRVLGMAYRICPEDLCDISPDGVEINLVFVGLAGMMDPPRPEVLDSIKIARGAGIKSVMITGDNQYTAVAIANELGMFEEDDAVLTGSALDALSDEDLTDAAPQVRVYARVSPEHKLRIVQALKSRGHVTAMTGDGVNDAPALKYADIGIAMGVTGTDVAKEASDMILTDDNYASIVNAIEEGRGIGDNTRKFISYLLSCNAGEILVIFLASITLSIFFRWPLPLLAIQILFINLVTDGLPALALGMDPMEPDVMKRKPRDPQEGVITRRVWILIWIVGITIAFVTLGLFAISMQNLTMNFGYSPEEAVLRAGTLALTLLVMTQMVQALNSRSGRLSLFQVGFFKNRYLLFAIGISIILQLMIVYFPPFQVVFRTVPLLLQDWIIIILLSLLVFVVVEIYKFLIRYQMRRATTIADKKVSTPSAS
ncbi:MAG: calcium-translocating P-type ATPase, SERCA-type [Candidatus Thorarchaeota archaeon]